MFHSGYIHSQGFKSISSIKTITHKESCLKNAANRLLLHHFFLIIFCRELRKQSQHTLTQVLIENNKLLE